MFCDVFLFMMMVKEVEFGIFDVGGLCIFYYSNFFTIAKISNLDGNREFFKFHRILEISLISYENSIHIHDQKKKRI